MKPKHLEIQSKLNFKRLLNKKKLIQYKGGKCIICKYDKDIPAAYDFHHVDPSRKSFGIANRLLYSMSKLTKEADKCVLLCCRCHQEFHEGMHTI